MLKLLICRHGESEADLEPRRIEGAADFPLTDKGHRQAERLAEAVAAQYRVDRVIASPLRRAQATAAKIAAATGAPLKTDQRLAEGSRGVLGGLTIAEADRLYPVKHPVTVIHRPPEGESYLDHYHRVAEVWFELLYDDSLDGQTICLVAHGGTINVLMDAALGLPPLAKIDFLCADTSLSELRLRDGRVQVARWNDSTHLMGLA